MPVSYFTDTKSESKLQRKRVMTKRKTAEHHPARDGDMLRAEKIEQLKKKIAKGDYEVENKFQKIVDSFVNEFVR